MVNIMRLTFPKPVTEIYIELLAIDTDGVAIKVKTDPEAKSVIDNVKFVSAGNTTWIQFGKENTVGRFMTSVLLER